MKGRTLFLHAGLPKCASSALQDWAESNRALLADQGIGWPETDPAGLAAARHQWLVDALVGAASARARLETVLGQATGDLLISAEALATGLHDFPEAGLSWFRAATQGWRVRLILLTRPISDWQNRCGRKA